MKIAFFECEKDEVSVLKKALSGHNLTFFPEALDEKNAGKAGDAEIACVFIYSKINSRAIEKMRNLKLIVTRSTGYDHIDIEACKKRGILISNIPRYGENTVAEHAFSLLLALSRKIREAKEQIEKKKINIKSLECFDLKGKTLGVIGAGRIGLSMIKMAKGFNMNVIAYDTYQNNEAAKELGFSYVSFDELLRSSDVITIHALLTEKTYHLIDEKAFKKMKKGVVLINTARGKIVKLDALVRAIREKKVSCAGMDVFEHEELLTKKKKEDNLIHYLLGNKNVLITPHMAFYSKESRQREIETTLENINCFLHDKPANLVQ